MYHGTQVQGVDEVQKSMCRNAQDWESHYDMVWQMIRKMIDTLAVDFLKTPKE